MPRQEIEDQARAKARREGIEYSEALESIIKDLPPSPTVMGYVKDSSVLEGGRQPYEFVGQLKLFKAGMLGTAVTIWSSYEDGYGPTQLMLDEEQPVIIHLADDKIEDQVRFGAAYIAGYAEGTEGDPEKLQIWLEPHHG